MDGWRGQDGQEGLGGVGVELEHDTRLDLYKRWRIRSSKVMLKK